MSKYSRTERLSRMCLDQSTLGGIAVQSTSRGRYNLNASHNVKSSLANGGWDKSAEGQENAVVSSSNNLASRLLSLAGIIETTLTSQPGKSLLRMWPKYSCNREEPLPTHSTAIVSRVLPPSGLPATRLTPAPAMWSAAWRASEVYVESSRINSEDHNTWRMGCSGRTLKYQGLKSTSSCECMSASKDTQGRCLNGVAKAMSPNASTVGRYFSIKSKFRLLVHKCLLVQRRKGRST
mmetsp:Transcript_80121/g.229971  ORF Transcript_80121/g.229971 Transcript_80121/m.229971 type:complete len:236 (+) Transcript_80121:287-994(+)